MPAVSTTLYYGAPLKPAGREDNWVIDAISQPPDVIWNFRRLAVDTTITDLRDSALDPRLDDMDFQKLPAPTHVDQHDLLRKSASALRKYQIETEEVLKSITHANDIVFFDASVRHEGTETVQVQSAQSAHLRVHVDQNPRSALARALSHGGSELRFSRFQIVNVWKPLVAPVRNFPLALCDYRSLNLASDLVRTRLDYPDWLKDKENYSLKYSPSHRWYYWSSLSPDETLVFKCYDSASRGLALVNEVTERDGLLDVAGLCPHSAFFDHGGPNSGHLRTSLELRALLFYTDGFNDANAFVK